MRRSRLHGGMIIMKFESVLLEAEYTNIILTLLETPYNISSVTKLTFIAFCVKHENNMLSYRNRTKDFVDTFISNVSLKLTAHYEDIKIIFQVLKILQDSQIIDVEKDEIKVVATIPSHTNENDFLNFCSDKIPNPIVEINKLDSKALIEEVIRYV